MCKFVVTEKAQRPASINGKCFYCQQIIGSFHADDCVLVNKKIKIRMIVDYDIQIPASWGKDQIEFHRNKGSWCASNALDELSKFNCICDMANFKYLETVSEPYLDED